LRNTLYWIAIGGLSFWLPVIVVALALNENVDVLTLNLLPLLGLIALGTASRLGSKCWPKWTWVLAGIYILGPVCMMAPAIVRGPSSPSVPKSVLFTVLICIFPPMTLWIALLNGMIFAVIIATLTLPFLPAHSQR